MSVRCYLSLGSNLRSPERQIRQAIRLLSTIPQSTLHKQSALYFNQAVGLRAQPDFCNAVVSLNTRLTPTELLHYCQQLEYGQGRVRKRRWGARTLDIDILLYGQFACQTPTLTLPHPRLLERNFVLIPLAQISPHLILPNGTALP
jgi:2-amino-4-hydroxy-6-hydroxymethyldihydropteridine diphosphokinase